MNGNITKEEIKSIIYEVRGKQVILASDLAKLFDTETRLLNQKVKRNIDKFYDYYFQLTKEENDVLWSQNELLKSQSVISSCNSYGGVRHLPYVFTIEGISILETITRSKEMREIIRLILEVFKEKNEYQIILKSPELREENIRNMIYEIRGKRVILDKDIAKLFQYETKMLNRQVLRNIDRFPENYCFQLTEEEYSNSLRCQNGTLNETGRGKHSKYLPYAFTEYGVVMLTSVLKSKVAIEASLKITNTFLEMRKIISEELLENKFYKNLILKHDERIEKLEATLKELKTADLKEKIFFNGEIYDAYSKIVDIMKMANNELVVIDGYADKSFLDMITDIKAKVTLITKNKTLLKNIDIERYQKQYDNLNIIYNDDFHDRFIIIDKKQIYHLGTSLNHAGNKVFAINKLEEQEMVKGLLNKINNLNNTKI